MGKPTGFMEYDRCEARSVEPKERIKNFDEFHIFLSKEKQREQAARCMDCGVPFCQSGMTVAGMTSGCPLHNLVPEWNDLLYTGNYQQAYNRLHKTNNFPEFTSRVCPALCEKACTCGHWGDPVSVRDNEHGIIETAYKEGYAGPHIPKVRTGKKVAIIGSGPSGLAAADQLNQRGHEVTVYERDDRVGGLLMYGIPNMKLEKQIIDRKINVMKEEGVKFITGCNVGVDVKSAELLKSMTESSSAVEQSMRVISRQQVVMQKESILQSIICHATQRAFWIPILRTTNLFPQREKCCDHRWR